MAQQKDLSKVFSFRRIIIPIIAGLAVATYLLVSNFDPAAFENIFWTWETTLWIIVALVMVVLRDLGYMLRLRILTDGYFSWRRSFDVIMLWEFASAITPSVVGGSGVAIYIITKEGLGAGKSTSVVMVTALLDEIFYIVMVPIVFLMIGAGELFPHSMEKEIMGITLGTKGIFIVGYLFIVLLTSTIVLAIFVNPRGLKSVLLSVFKIKYLRRWRYSAIEIGNDIITTSKHLKNKSFLFWLKAFGATFCSWTARYWVVNFMILAFLPVSDHLLIYARQLVMWVIMLISPTPGSSGVAELAFSGFLKEFTLGLAAALCHHLAIVNLLSIPLRRFYHSTGMGKKNSRSGNNFRVILFLKDQFFLTFTLLKL